MDDLIQFVKLHIEEVTRQNFLNTLVIRGLMIKCKDIEIFNEMLEQMLEINITQAKRLSKETDPTKPAEVVDLSLEVIESSSYLSITSAAITSIFPEENSFTEELNKVQTHSDYVQGLMDALLRKYLVNIPDELLQGYIEEVSEEEIDKVVESLNRIISKDPEDNYAKELVERLKNKKVELMAATPNESTDDSSIGQMHH